MFIVRPTETQCLAVVNRPGGSGLSRLPDGRGWRPALLSGQRRCVSGSAGLMSWINDDARLLKTMRRPVQRPRSAGWPPDRRATRRTCFSS